MEEEGRGGGAQGRWGGEDGGSNQFQLGNEMIASIE